MALAWMLTMLAAEVRVAVGADGVEDAAVLVRMLMAGVVPPDNAPTHDPPLPPLDELFGAGLGLFNERVRQVIQFFIYLFIKKLLGAGLGKLCQTALPHLLLRVRQDRQLTRAQTAKS